MKVLIVATVQSHVCQFHQAFATSLRERGATVHAAARDNLAEKNGLTLDFVDRVFNVPFKRSPFNVGNMKAYRQLKRIIVEGDYDVVHCNTPVGGVLTRIACRKLRKRGLKVIYTAHGFHFYKGASKRNWLIYYPIERFFARWTDALITINREDYERAQKSMKAKKVVYVPGVGVDLKKFAVDAGDANDENSTRNRTRRSLGIERDEKALIYVGELNKNKNQSSLLDMLNELVKTKPNVKLILVGNGGCEEKLREKRRRLGLTERVIFTGYRRDVPALLAADVAVPSSVREGLGLNLIEAAACGLPVVAYDNRGHRSVSKTAKAVSS